MSDEHNTPENSPTPKASRPRRTTAAKAAAKKPSVEKTAAEKTVVDQNAVTASPAAEHTAGETASKPARTRTTRAKSAAAPKAKATAETTAVPAASDSPAPKKAPAKPARKSTPKAKTDVAPAPGATEAPANEEKQASPKSAAGKSTARKSSAAKSAARKSTVKSTPAPVSPLAAAEAGEVAITPAEKDTAGATVDKKTPAAKPKASRSRTAKAVASKATPPAESAATAEVEKPASQAAASRPVSQESTVEKVVESTAAATRNESTEVQAPPSQEASPSEAQEDAQSAPQAETQDDQPAPRKSRRGRRGGRGRGRGKNRAAEAAANGDSTSLPQADATQDSLDDTEDAAASAPANAAVNSAPSPAGKKDVKKDSGKKAGKDKEKSTETESKPSRRKMFISVVPGEQVEVALVEEGVIGEYYLDMLHQAKVKGNIYKGVVHNVDPNLQAAFVNYGTGKNGFLQIDEIHPEYYLSPHESAKGKKFPPIQKVIKPGQEVLVQVVKEPTGNKGAFLTTWLSLAGRFLVLTPGQEQIGVSRKVDNDEERARLREMMNGIEPGEGLGVIVRTVSAGTSKTTLKNDLQYLKRVWKEIRRRGTSESAPSLIYKESGLAERAVRDYLTEDVQEVWVDNESVAESLRETVALLFPRKEDLVRVHADVRQTLWERFNIQRQLEQIYSREVILPSGGRLVFDQTEALMAIDINSGKISGKANFESMALKTNIEAAEAIARHLKLRDIGGQVVIDFIEMRDKNHVREVEKTLRNAMKNDRARHDVARMSSFGLLEIVRQRTGSSALAVTMEPCPCCNGTGIRRNMEWQSLQALRQIGRQARTPGTTRCIFEANTELGMYLLNHKRDRLREMEQQLNVPIEIRIQP